MTKTPPEPTSNQAPTLTLTVEEVAHELRCTSRHVQNLIARDVLPCVRLGRAVRVPRSALVAIIEGDSGRSADDE